MIHDKMVHHIKAQRANRGPDLLVVALTDWLYLGRFTGCRSIEWCQRTQKAYLRIDHPNWKGPDSYALIGEDVLFHNSRKQLIPEPCDVDPDTIDHITVRFRKQKNNLNYYVISYKRDSTNPQFCPVLAALRIRQRARRLNLPPDEPLGVYLSNSGKYKGTRCFITNNQVAIFLQRAAMAVFELKHGDS